MKRPQKGAAGKFYTEDGDLYAWLESVVGPAPEGTPDRVVAAGRAIAQAIADRHSPDHKGICKLRDGKRELQEIDIDEQEAIIINDRLIAEAEAEPVRDP